jgi:gas vesicle protein
MSEDGNDFGAFLTGLIVGGLVGAATALLLAPQSGEETRTIIKEKSIELKDRAMETAEDARVQAEKALEEARLRANELQQRGQELIDEQRTRLENTIDAGKNAAQRAQEDLGATGQPGETPPAK